MIPTAEDLDRCSQVLRATIRRKGFTQLAVERSLGWERKSIRRLLKKKQIRLDQLAEILSVLRVDLADFFAEVFAPRWPRRDQQELEELWSRYVLLQGLMVVLVEKGLVTPEEIDEGADAVAAAEAA